MSKHKLSSKTSMKAWGIICKIASPTKAPAAKASKIFRKFLIDGRYFPFLSLNLGPILTAQMKPETAIMKEDPIA